MSGTAKTQRAKPPLQKVLDSLTHFLSANTLSNLIVTMTASNDEHKESTVVFNRHSNAPSTRPKPHRCNEHLEDVLNGVSTWPMDFSKPFGVFWKCLRSQPGMKLSIKLCIKGYSRPK